MTSLWLETQNLWVCCDWNFSGNWGDWIYVSVSKPFSETVEGEGEVGLCFSSSVSNGNRRGSLCWAAAWALHTFGLVSLVPELLQSSFTLE